LLKNETIIFLDSQKVYHDCATKNPIVFTSKRGGLPAVNTVLVSTTFPLVIFKDAHVKLVKHTGLVSVGDWSELFVHSQSPVNNLVTLNLTRTPVKLLYTISVIHLLW